MIAVSTCDDAMAIRLSRDLLHLHALLCRSRKARTHRQTKLKPGIAALKHKSRAAPASEARGMTTTKKIKMSEEAAGESDPTVFQELDHVQRRLDQVGLGRGCKCFLLALLLVL